MDNKLNETLQRFDDAQKLLAEKEENRVTEAILNENDESASIQINIQEIFEVAFDKFLKGASMLQKLTFLINMVNKAESEGKEVDFDLIYGYLRKYPKMDDFNIFDKPESIKDLYSIYEDLHYASFGLIPWQKHKCKSCGKTFFLTIGEVNFFIRKGLQLPKRCENCRNSK